MSFPKDPARPQEHGQAMPELLLILPLLLLLAAATAQFTVLFLTQIRFEQACHQAARRYAAGLTGRAGMDRVILERMGPYRRFLREDSVLVRPSGLSTPSPGDLGDAAAAFLRLPPRLLLDQGGGPWTAQAVTNPPFLFHPLFREGIPFRTRFYILRHPRGDGHGS